MSLEDYLNNSIAGFGDGKQPTKVIPFLDYGNIAGRLVEIYGKHSSGKTTLLYEQIKNWLNDFTILYIETEYKFDKLYAQKRIGDLSGFLYKQSNDAPEVIDICSSAIGTVDIIIIDSFTALNVDYFTALSYLLTLFEKVMYSQTALIGSNQIRTNISKGKDTDWASNYFSDVAALRLEMKHVKSLKDDWEHIGKRVKGTLVKNILSNNYQPIEMDIL
jgi:RecA/RadA recombinase